MQDIDMENFDYNYREGDSELDKMRKERDEYYYKAREVQERIDKYIMDKNDFSDLKGKYIKYFTKNNSHNVIYLHVTDIKRLFHGVELYGFKAEKHNRSLFILPDSTLNLYYESKDNYVLEFISHEEFKDLVNKHHSDLMEKL